MDKNKGELLHTLPTEFGHSGSPIIVKDAGGNLVIIAIHKGAVRKKKTN
jgi:V8-like Glu-specific endopeptidase